MGTAILSGILNAPVKPRNDGRSTPRISRFLACIQSDASEQRLRSEFATHKDRLDIVKADNPRAFRTADIIILACKPYMAEAILGEAHAEDALRGKLVISVLAGVTSQQLESYISGEAYPDVDPADRCVIIRAMPNMAAKIGKSITMIAIPDSSPPKHYADITAWIFRKIGDTCYIPDELFHAGSVLAGATPAFLTIAFDGILDAAVKEGIKRDVAGQILAQSWLGAATLLQHGEHPAILREKIASPKGTTIQGLMELEKSGVRSAFSDAFVKSTERGKNMNP